MLENLNEKQKLATMNVENNLCIIAGAGSGKTRVITSRIAYLIKNHGIKDYRILAITFTNHAANEMKERLNKMIENHRVNAMTIHALCVRILREEIQNFDYPKDFTIIDVDDQKRILNNIIKDKKINMENYKIGEVISFISNNKMAKVSTGESYKLSKTDRLKLFSTLYEKYEKRLQQMKCLDFNDLLLFANKVLDNPEIKEKWQNRYSFIHVDEFQDIDNIQYEIIKKLVGEHTNICVVGDPDQCIYTWRGANISYILKFEKDFKNAITIILNQNYRSTPEILNAANSLIIKNENRIKKDLITENMNGEKVKHFSGQNENEETQFIIDEIRQLKKNGVNYNEIAILYRSNFSSRVIEKYLVDAKIPYHIRGSVRFFERAEIKDALCYLRMLVDNAAIDLSLDRIINVPRRGIGEKTLATIRSIAIKENIAMYDVIKNISFTSGKIKKSIDQFVEIIEKYRIKKEEMPFHRALGLLLSEIGYYAMLKDTGDEERINNISSFIQDIAQYEEANPGATIEEYLQEIALYSEANVADAIETISLMSIHAAKGTEYNYVFIYNMSEGIFPNERSILEGGLEEERRIAYVAMTRAKKRLYLTESRGFHFSGDKIKTTSRFIKEIDGKYLYTATKQLKAPIEHHKNMNRKNQKNNDIGILRKGDKVEHGVFGKGIVITVVQETATIAFPAPHGIKKILATHTSLKKG